MILKGKNRTNTYVYEINILNDNIEYKVIVYVTNNKISDIIHKNDFKIKKHEKIIVENEAREWVDNINQFNHFKALSFIIQEFQTPKGNEIIKLLLKAKSEGKI